MPVVQSSGVGTSSGGTKKKVPGFDGSQFAAGAERQAARKAARRKFQASQASVPPPPRRAGGGGRARKKGGGGGGGGKGGIGSGGFQAPTSGSGGQEGTLEGDTNRINQLIIGKLEKRLRGEGGFFTPEVMTQMKQELFEENQGAQRRAEQQLNADVARRGLFRTGIAAKGAAQIGRAALSSYTRGIRALLLKKAELEWQDEKEATRDAQQWLNGQRTYMLGKEQNAIAREQVKATIAAASISASASRYAADQGLKGARAAAGASRFASDRSYSLGVKQHQLNVAKARFIAAGGTPGGIPKGRG